ncbi:MAG: endonuclease III [Candidatus Micrarchaeota archaeon]|nr:endonuclease III [Candidatus Micrarchaeota archaeon]
MGAEQNAAKAAKAANACALLERRFGRPRPARNDDPLDSLVEVILSQNTSDKNSRPAFLALKKKFPKWEKLLAAPQKEVEQAIRSSGFYRIKAKRIRAALAGIKKERGRLDLSFLSKLPTAEAKKFLLSLYGVGPKSAAIILNFSFARPEFPVDTHIYRVTRRLGLAPLAASREKTQDNMNSLVPDGEKTPCHINLIQLGRTVCKPRNPLCSKCPLERICPRVGVRKYK